MAQAHLTNLLTWTFCVGHTWRWWHTGVVATNFREGTVAILNTLHTTLANAADTKLTIGAVCVDHAGLIHLAALAVTKVTHFAHAAVHIAVTFGRWNRKAGTCKAALTGRALCIRTATIGVEALEVDTLCRCRTLIGVVRVTEWAKQAATGHTLKAVLTIRIGLTGRWLTVAKITTLGGCAIVVVDTIAVDQACTITTLRTGRTIRVALAAAHELTLIANTRLTSGTIRAVHAGGFCKTGATEQVTSLTHHTIGVQTTTGARTTTVGGALTVCRAICISLALCGAWAADAVDTTLIWRTIGVEHASVHGWLTNAIIALEADGTIAIEHALWWARFA